MTPLKCIIWDLDDTLWEGTCLEDAEVSLRPGIRDVLAAFRARGLIQAIASKNEPAALRFIDDLNLGEFFVHPEVNWEPKEDNIRRIAEVLNLGLDSIAFVDDNPFERESVQAALPAVRVYDAADYLELPDLPETCPEFDTEESRQRPSMYVAEAQRAEAEGAFEGKRAEFLRTLETVVRARPAIPGDTTRIAELLERTNQFNAAGLRFSDEEIRSFLESDEHELHIVTHSDRFGDNGRSGVALLRWSSDALAIETLLLSCRVAGRGLGPAFLTYLSRLAHDRSCTRIEATYVRNDRNRQIGLMYQLAGFRKSKDMSDGNRSTFVYELSAGPTPCPDWIRIEAMVDAR